MSPRAPTLRPRSKSGELPLLWSDPGLEPETSNLIQAAAKHLLRAAPACAPARIVRRLTTMAEESLYVYEPHRRRFAAGMYRKVLSQIDAELDRSRRAPRTDEQREAQLEEDLRNKPAPVTQNESEERCKM
ncbi:hypothetical protein LTR62_008836 [Meristemomyces frigidus]|uniref:Uncharacterized protein n=1 Tax=Meristemomyces frigidus TaxID=1508187 RepID=A0AAN7YN05_9PEZI|nr:hypothetical protein LTR62_008836 [Meristemomyces frigidus]